MSATVLHHKRADGNIISFNVPPVVGGEEEYIHDAISIHRISGDGKYTKLCNELIEKQLGAAKNLLGRGVPGIQA